MTSNTPPPNFHTQSIWTGDNLPIMRGFNSASIDLIYLDPPFNSKADYAAPIGSKAAGAAFKDTWTLSDVDAEWINLIEAKHPALYRVLLAAMSNSDKSYLAYMAVRLLEMHRILKPTGSIYLHCDPTASHYLKLIMDAIFGRNNFRNEIIWQRNDGRGKGSQFKSKKFGANTDTILFYTKTNKYQLNATADIDPEDEKMLEKFNKIDEKGRRYQTGIPVFCSKSMGARPNLCFEWRGFENPHPSGWRLSKERLEEEYQKGNIVITAKKDGTQKIERRQYMDEYKGVPIDNNWTDIPRVTRKESSGYPTQKPLALLERIIKASSHEGDMVLDPFCGCATTCVAAERLGRQWVGIDISAKAAELVRARAENELTDLLSSQNKIFEITHRTDIPKRSDMGKLPPYQSHKKTLYGEQEGKCNGCAEHFKIQNFDVDHIIARTKGGTDHIENLQLLCGHCNAVKGARSMEYLKSKLSLSLN